MFRFPHEAHLRRLLASMLYNTQHSLDCHSTGLYPNPLINLVAPLWTLRMTVPHQSEKAADL